MRSRAAGRRPLGGAEEEEAPVLQVAAYRPVAVLYQALAEFCEEVDAVRHYKPRATGPLIERRQASIARM